jgi:hypothetical protein
MLGSLVWHGDWSLGLRAQRRRRFFLMMLGGFQLTPFVVCHVKLSSLLTLPANPVFCATDPFLWPMVSLERLVLDSVGKESNK